MLKCGFKLKSFEIEIVEITLWHGCFPVNFLHIFRTPFTKNISERLRSSRPEVFCKNFVPKNFTNSQENTCARVYFLIKLQSEAGNFIKKETLAEVFSCEFCEILKNTFFYRTPSVAASDACY